MVVCTQVVPSGGDDREGVAVRAEVGDLEDALGIERADAVGVGLCGDVGAIGVDALGEADTAGARDGLAEGVVLGAERVPEDVGGDQVDVVGDEALEPGQAALGRDVRRAVRDGDVLEHQRLDGGGRQRVGLQHHLDRDHPRVGHGEVLAVQLVAVGEDRDEVATRRDVERYGEVALVALGQDGAGAGDGLDRGPGAARRVGGIGRGAGRHPRLGHVPGVVDVDDVAIAGDRQGRIRGVRPPGASPAWPARRWRPAAGRRRASQGRPRSGEPMAQEARGTQRGQAEVRGMDRSDGTRRAGAGPGVRTSARLLTPRRSGLKKP